MSHEGSRSADVSERFWIGEDRQTGPELRQMTYIARAFSSTTPSGAAAAVSPRSASQFSGPVSPVSSVWATGARSVQLLVALVRGH